MAEGGQVEITDLLGDTADRVIGMNQQRAGFLHSSRQQQLVRAATGDLFEQRLELTQAEAGGGG